MHYPERVPAKYNATGYASKGRVALPSVRKIVWVFILKIDEDPNVQTVHLKPRSMESRPAQQLYQKPEIGSLVP